MDRLFGWTLIPINKKNVISSQNQLDGGTHVSLKRCEVFLDWRNNLITAVIVTRDSSSYGF